MQFSSVYRKNGGGEVERNQGYRVVNDLVEPYHGTWRGITTDNFFTSVPLAQCLLSKNLTLFLRLVGKINQTLHQS